jgi:hypothetical protein
LRDDEKDSLLSSRNPKEVEGKLRGKFGVEYALFPKHGGVDPLRSISQGEVTALRGGRRRVDCSSDENGI